MGEFEEGREEWTQYAERPGHFLKANGITGGDKKRAVFLSVIGPKAYKLLESLIAPVSQRIRSPRKSDPGRIRYASDIDPTLADSIRGINGVIGFPLSTSQSKLWCIHADLT